MKRNLLLYVIAPIMSMLYSKIKIEIDTNNDELLETVWEHIREIKWGKGRQCDVIELINLHFLYHYFYLTFSK